MKEGLREDQLERFESRMADYSGLSQFVEDIAIRIDNLADTFPVSLEVLRALWFLAHMLTIDGGRIMPCDRLLMAVADPHRSRRIRAIGRFHRRPTDGYV